MRKFLVNYKYYNDSKELKIGQDIQNDSKLFLLLFQFVVVVLLFYVHGKHLRSCRDGQLA